VDEDSTDTAACEVDFLRCVIGAVVHIHGARNTTLEDGILEAIDQVGGVVVEVELAMGDNTGGIVNEADKVGFRRLAFDSHEGADEGVALPHIVGVGLGEGSTFFAGDFGIGLEQFEALDVATEGVFGDLLLAEKPQLNALPVNGGDVVAFVVEVWENLFNGVEEFFGSSFSGFSCVTTSGAAGNTVAAVMIPPGLDGAPGELVGHSSSAPRTFIFRYGDTFFMSPRRLAWPLA